MTLFRWACAIALACLSARATAQSYPLSASPDGWARPTSPCVYDPATKLCAPTTASAPLPVLTINRAETFQLATANTASAPVTLVGGSYILAQSCTGYGSVSLRYRGPDGAAMVAMVTKTAADSAGGTLVQLGGGAIVDVSLSGTTGCNVSLTRVPQ
ncbi:hypothetical protein [Sphingomonas sanguinis]|uniref:hypothetical protein n=1 Tax=Sphingomonas sanguinis TaxID=33051 RepID=UPI00073679F5|nr:hypothetical protein [Sphingomonas sanguinis]